MAKMPAPEDAKFTEQMALNKYQTILKIELNNGICYSRHHLMVPGNFYPRVAGSFKKIELFISSQLRKLYCLFPDHSSQDGISSFLITVHENLCPYR